MHAAYLKQPPPCPRHIQPYFMFANDGTACHVGVIFLAHQEPIQTLETGRAERQGFVKVLKGMDARLLTSIEMAMKAT